MQTTAPLEFVRRGRSHDDDTARVMVWRSRCGRYRVCRRTSRFFRDRRNRPSVRYVAQWAVTAYARNRVSWQHVRDGTRTYRTRQAAERACQEHVELGSRE